MLQYTEILSKSNRLVIEIGKLKDKKYRNESKLFLLDGKKLFLEATSKNVDLKYIIFMLSKKEEMLKIIEEKLPKIDSKILIGVSDEVFYKISEEKSPEGIICVAKYLDKLHKIGTIEMVQNEGYIIDERILLLESIRDVGNMGTIIRTASAFSIDKIFISSDCADIYNPKTIRASMGALFSQKIIIVEDLKKTISSLKKVGFSIYTAALDRDAKKINEIKFEGKCGIVIGNEGHGLSNEVIAEGNGNIFIPIAENTESLNASIAGSICMWELSRK